ncbi:MAG: rRNA methyltransferase [Candidatus Doudnabacteria bacterium]|nr:rRNA methyltransferase [Candidatus Doudnabacteria bacterium]
MKPKIKKIYSENSDFQLIETLRRNREKRSKQGLFFVEGVRPINQALAHDWNIHAFIYNPSKLSSWAHDILHSSKAEIHYELSSTLLHKLSLKEEGSELLAVLTIPKDNLDKIPVSKDLLVIVFDRPVSPGNLGSLIRSADALKVNSLIVTGHAADLYDPEVISASRGSSFVVPTVRLPSHKELLPWIDKLKKQYTTLQVIATDENGKVAIDQHDFKKPTILLVGNETKGLSEAYREIADTIVKIPMYGSASSLNVTAASSIVLYEIDRQRRNTE